MSYTYEIADRATRLETYEWDNTWLEQTGKTDTPRVLYIGDSISCGTRKLATERSQGRLLFDGFGTSKALDNPYLLDSIRLFAAQQGSRAAIIVNNGLHGWHIDDSEEYPVLYERLLRFLLTEFAGTPIFSVLTTSVRDGAREERVRARNAAVARVSAELSVPVIDLYSVAREFAELRSGDGVHYTREGYEKFADLIISEILSAIG